MINRLHFDKEMNFRLCFCYFLCEKFNLWSGSDKSLHQPGSTHVLGDRNGRYTHTVGYSRWRWSSSSRITIITTIITLSTINYNHLSAQWSNVGPWPGGPPCHSRRSSCPSRLRAQVVTSGDPQIRRKLENNFQNT